MNYFKTPLIISLIGIIGAFLYGGKIAAYTVVVLSILEISLSFDNAVVNATKLKTMSKLWQDRFLTWGILVAVFGMRLLLPIVVVSLATSLSLWDTVTMAMNNPTEYTKQLLSVHGEISAFGSGFLLMVFLSFFTDEDKTEHWHCMLESFFANKQLNHPLMMVFIGNVIIGSVLLFGVTFIDHNLNVSHLWLNAEYGIILWIAIDFVSDNCERYGDSVKSAGIMGLIYLEVLDASFSFDGVIGAFAISTDIVIIMIGLGIGAMFVRTITIKLVRDGVIDEYQYLEHGAHYAIGVLGLLMLISSTGLHISELLIGLVGVFFVTWAFVDSLKCKGEV